MSQLEIIEMICSYTEYTLKFNELMSSLNKKILILFYDTIMNNLDKIPYNKQIKYKELIKSFDLSLSISST